MATLTKECGNSSTEKKTHLCETPAAKTFAAQHLRHDKVLCAAYETVSGSATKRFPSTSPNFAVGAATCFDPVAASAPEMVTKTM